MVINVKRIGIDQILEYLKEARSSLTHLYSICHFSLEHKELIEQCNESYEAWKDVEEKLHMVKHVADSLYYKKEDMKLWQVPMFEVQTAWQILNTGHFYF